MNVCLTVLPCTEADSETLDLYISKYLPPETLLLSDQLSW